MQIRRLSMLVLSGILLSAPQAASAFSDSPSEEECLVISQDCQANWQAYGYASYEDCYYWQGWGCDVPRVDDPQDPTKPAVPPGVPIGNCTGRTDCK